MGFLLMGKMTAVRTRIWLGKRHYMELNLDVFLKTGQHNPVFFKDDKTDDFAGIFPISTKAGPSNDLYCITLKGVIAVSGNATVW
ncbi:hypothetical protein [Methanoregula sp.]|jgi:hypothetical protein|uniref:hypothetical protein n=1 Tax=Methanoregula sp. TaxID=2052170 RepID=UPI003564AD11